MNYDAIIIGFGKGGKTLAAHLAKQGKQVALVERSAQMYGGTCINVGCIPSKSLVRSAGISKSFAEESFEQKAERYARAIAEKRRVTAMLRQKNYDKLNHDPNVTVWNGVARFKSQTAVEVQTEQGSELLEAPQIFINTGASAVIPRIEGLKQNPHVYDSASLMDLEELPKQLVIIGGGYIGLEFASMYANFGSKVTVLQDGAVLVPREDADISAALQSLLEGQGVCFRLGAVIRSVSAEGTVTYEWNGQHISEAADAVLVATGRRPNTDDLNLAAANVAVNQRGAVVVNEWLQTTQAGIWAMGDVAGGLQFTYVSLDDYRIVASQLTEGAKPYSSKTRQNVPYSVFLSTPFSRVGLNEAEARAAGYEIRILSLPAAAIPKAQVLRRTEGLLKAIVDRRTGKILGAMLLCEESYEMINIVKLAMDLGADYTVLRDQVFTHPTMSEALNDLFSL